MSNDYDGVFGFPIELLITPDGGAQMEVYGVLTTDPPANERNQETIIPASGTLAGQEKVLLAALKVTEINVEALYDKTNFLAVLALSGYALAFEMTIGSGAGEIVYTATGSMKKAAQQKADPGKALRAQYTFTIDAGWTAA